MARRRMTPGRRARRALAVDLTVAAAIALLVLELTAGLAVVAFVCVPLLLIGLIWIAAERLARRIGLRRRPAA